MASGSFVLAFVNLAEQLLEVFSQAVDLTFPTSEALATEHMQRYVTDQHSEEKA
jgi:hypothetical protein